jgi:hypothetical protein
MALMRLAFFCFGALSQSASQSAPIANPYRAVIGAWIGLRLPRVLVLVGELA